jgi:hypothetical protein
MNLIKKNINNLIEESEKCIFQFQLDKSVAKVEKAYSL